MVRRHAILALAALIFGAGCHAGPAGGLTRSEPPLAKETISKTRIIAKINKNSASIRSLQAYPAIAAKESEGRSVGLRGRMAMDRPKDFRLEIAFHNRPLADIGSNDQGFWFWVKDEDKKDQAIYVCDYEHVDASPLTVTMQPEWIMEAMGLREISEREAATISAEKGDKPGQLVLTQFRKDEAKRQTYTKVTVVDEQTGEIKEHRLYSGAKKELLARATITETQRIQMKPTDDNPSGSVVDFPSKIQLEWIVEKFSLDITMGKPNINPQFPSEQRMALFTEPTISGAKRQNLALLGNGSAPASSRIYESSPRSGVRLGQPEAEPNGVEGATRSRGDSQSLSADLSDSPSRPSEYVGPQVPRGTDPEAVQASANRRGWGSPIVEQ